MVTAEAPALRSSALADIVLAPRDGRTRLIRVETRPPLTVQRALYLDERLPDQAWVFLANPSAGLLAGDEHEVRARLESGARAHLTTQAATKVFSMPGGSARQRVQLTVGEGAVLEYLPEPIIPFRDSDFDQRVHLTIEDGATAFVSEIIVPGRLAHGERFAYRRLRSSITVERPGRGTLYHEAFSLEPGRRPVTRLGLLGDGATSVLATLVAVGPGLDAVDVGRELGDEPCADVAGLPPGGGLVVKAITADVSAARAAVRRSWAVVRRQALGAEPPVDRRR